MGIFSFFKSSTDSESEIDPLKMIREFPEYAAACNYDLNELHCKKCPNSCTVANAKCTFGHKLRKAFEDLGK